MEWKRNFGMEYGRCSEWIGMEDLKNRMEDRLPYGAVATGELLGAKPPQYLFYPRPPSQKLF